MITIHNVILHPGFLLDAGSPEMAMDEFMFLLLHLLTLTKAMAII